MADNNNNENNTQDKAQAVFLPVMDISQFPAVTMPRPTKLDKGSGYNLDSYSVDLLARSNGSHPGALHVGYLMDILREVLTPTIDEETGYWYVGNIKTNVKAKGRTPAFRYTDVEKTDKNGEKTTSRVLQVGYWGKNLNGEDEFMEAQELLDVSTLVPYFAWIRFDQHDKVVEEGGDLWLTYTLGGVTYKLIAADRLKLRFSDLTPEDIAVLQAPARAVIAEVEAALIRANTASEKAEAAEVLAKQAVDDANEATGKANTATTNANEAADNANAAADRVTDAILDLSAEKQAAQAAAAAANTAAGNANTATTNANNAAAAATTAKANADTAASGANAAAAAANTAKANADAATTAANNAASAANTAKANADAATTAANNAASAANTAKANADTATANAQAATTAANNAASAANTAKTNAQTATTNANNAAAKAEKAAQNPPIIDPTTTNWKIWNADSDAYNQTSYPSRGLKGDKGDNAYSPRIKSATATWEIYDDATKKYVDTGVQVNSTYTLTADGIKTALGYTPADSTHTHSQYLTGITKAQVEAVLTGKITTHTHDYAATGHTHDDRYYTESEIDTKLNGKAASTHTHSDYAASGHNHDATYVKKSGDTMTGALNFANNAANQVGDDVYFGDFNGAGQFGIQGKNGNSGIAFLKKGDTWGSSANRYTMVWDGSNMTASSTALFNNLNADLLDGKHDGEVTAKTLTFPIYSSSSSDTSNLAIIKEHYKKLPVQTPCSIQLSHGSVAMAFGWRLGGQYDSVEKAYCGWFISDYGTPRWIGADNGTWKSETFAFTTSNVASATKLQTARTITIGSKGKTFDGSGDVSFTLAEIGAAATSHTHDYAATSHTHSYLPLAGGTMTGDILFSDSGTTTRQVRFQVGANDYARLAAGATASNAGWLELATGDDSNEPIYVRQYSGAFTTITRTATLLDASGNTSFPGSVTASSFIKSGGTASQILMADGSVKATSDFAAASHSHSYAATSHTHDDRYYTETEINTKLAGYAPLGANAVTALNAVPIDKPLVIATINSSTAQTFGLANTTVPAGREIHVIINNTSTAALTIALPTAAAYKNCTGEASITIEAGKFGEISAVSNGSNIYLRAVGS